MNKEKKPLVLSEELEEKVKNFSFDASTCDDEFMQDYIILPDLDMSGTADLTKVIEEVKEVEDNE